MKRLTVLACSEAIQQFIPTEITRLLEGFKALFKPVLVAVDRLSAESDHS